LTDKVLEVDNLVTRFLTSEATVHAVNGISFDVYEGEALGVVGESGCGKSVSMLSVLRLLPQPPATIASDGIQFLGKNIATANDREMRSIRGSKISMIFQDPMTSLNPVFSVGYQIMEPLQLHLGMSNQDAYERSIELLDVVGIPDAHERINDFPHQFSGGMRQRAMIAMSLACNPKLLIADEPTTALDVTIQAQIVELVKQLRDQFGMALIWITHDLGVVAGLVDRLNVMYAGLIVESAPTDDVYYTPLHPYTNALLHSLPRMDSSPGTKLASIEGMPPDLTELLIGCPFAPRCSFVQDKCQQENPTLSEVTPGHSIACWVDIEIGRLR
jgi:oligopeptide/dipeptide ABC transporter ATP-binding protein